MPRRHWRDAWKSRWASSSSRRRAFTPEQEKQAKEALTRTDVAQPALGAASLGMFRLLNRLGVQADLFAGHSYGDYVALCAAGALSSEDLIRLSHERGRIILEATERMPGAMAAIEADADTVAAVLDELDGVMAANLNSPNQTVISGSEEGIAAALECFQQARHPRPAHSGGLCLSFAAGRRRGRTIRPRS